MSNVTDGRFGRSGGKGRGRVWRSVKIAIGCSRAYRWVCWWRATARAASGWRRRGAAIVRTCVGDVEDVEDVGGVGGVGDVGADGADGAGQSGGEPLSGHTLASPQAHEGAPSTAPPLPAKRKRADDRRRRLHPPHCTSLLCTDGRGRTSRLPTFCQSTPITTLQRHQLPNSPIILIKWTYRESSACATLQAPKVKNKTSIYPSTRARRINSNLQSLVARPSHAGLTSHVYNTCTY